MSPKVKVLAQIFAVVLFASAAQAQYGVTSVTNSDFNQILKNMNECISKSCGGGPEKGFAIIDGYSKRKSEIPTAKKQGAIYPPEVLRLHRELTTKENELDTFTTEVLGRLNQQSQERLQGSAQRMHNFLTAAKFLEMVQYDKNVYGEDVRVNVEKSKEKMRDVPAVDRDWYLEIAANRLRILREFEISQSELESLSPVVILKALFRGVSTELGIELLRDRTRKEIAQVLRVSPFEQSLYFATLSHSTLQSLLLKDSKNLTENDLRDMIRWNVRTNESKSLFGAENTALLNRETPTIAEILKSAGGRDELLRTYAKMNDKKSKNNSEDFVSCETTYFMNTGLLPTSSEKARLKADVAETKSKVRAAIEANFPDSMKGALLDVVNRSEFVLPPTVDEFQRGFYENLRRDLNSAETSLGALKKAKESEIQGVLVALLSSPAFKATLDTVPKPDAPPETNALCDAFKYEPATDGNYTPLGTIVLSYTTPQLPEKSRVFLIGHELGHSIGQKLLDDPALRVASAPVRKCLAAAHKEPMTPASILYWQKEKARGARLDGLYVNEDMSDVIGFESSKELKGPNPWCPLMKRSIDKKSFADLSLISNPKDPHSANLFRLLALNFMRDGSMSPQCKDAFAGFGGFPEFENCLRQMKPGAQKAIAPAPAAGAPTSK